MPRSYIIKQNANLESNHHTRGLAVTRSERPWFLRQLLLQPPGSTGLQQRDPSSALKTRQEAYDM
jgi:hypothetical protein